MVTFPTWQFPHTFWNGGIVGLTMDKLWSPGKKKSSNEKVNEDEHKHKEMWKKM